MADGESVLSQLELILRRVIYNMEEYKGYRIVSDGTNLKRIRAMAQGKVPKDLEGLYTNTSFARLAIDRVVGTKETKKNGKTK